MKAFIKQLLPTLCAAALVSCTLEPGKLTRTRTEGGVETTTAMTWGGASILTRSDYERMTVTDGQFTATTERIGKDETRVPVVQAQWKAVAAGANALADGAEAALDAATN